MSDTFLLVDFENVREITLSRVQMGWTVKIFIGKSQNSIPFTLASDAQRLGGRLDWIKIEGDGRNNLDFHIAYYLGSLAKEHPAAAFVILSRDKGFDALLKHLSQRQIDCRRVENFADIVATFEEPDDSRFTRVLEILRKTEKKARPRRRKTLTQHIASVFQKKLKEDEIQTILESLFSKRLISETNNVVTYNF